MRGSRLRSVLVAGAVVGGLVATAGIVKAQNKFFIIIDDAATVETIIPALTSGNATAELETDDVWLEDGDGKAALRIDSPAGDNQKFNTNILDWSWSVVEDPTAADEMRYITFAWRQEGGAGTQLQLHGMPGTWGHRYHAGENPKGWNPSIEVTSDAPAEWQIFTRDMFDDWDEFILTGFAFSPGAPEFGLFDHMAVHQSEVDPIAPQAVDPKGKSAAVWAEIKQDIR